MKKIFASLFLLAILVPVVALAQAPATTTTTSGNPCLWSNIRTQGGNNDPATTLPRCINQVYVWSLGLAVLFAVLMIVVGGYYVMTSGGNAEMATKGKEYITSAIIGLVILFCAYLLLNTINPDLVNFNLDSIKELK